MFIDARTIPDGATIESDVCIIGAGAAGITLAHELRGQPFRVCLLESGGFACDLETQSLYEGESVGRPYLSPEDLASDRGLSLTRMRCFGGTTISWGGYCRPLDESDFEPREWVPHSGWPFDRSHLVPFYVRAQAICQLGTFSYNVADWETPDTPRLPLAADRVATKLLHLSPPTNFGVVYRSAIERAPNVHAYLYANAVEIQTASDGRTATHVEVATLQGKRLRVRARLFVLATGAIENARLLLLSSGTRNVGLGNQGDWVGRGFMDHLQGEVGLILPSRHHLMGLYSEHEVRRGAVRGRIMAILALTSETLRRGRLPNGHFGLREVWPPGITALRGLLGDLRHGRVDDDFLRRLRSVVSEMDDLARTVYRGARRRPIRLYRLGGTFEQMPNRRSRLTLSDQRDRLGKRRVRLDWRLNAEEWRGMRRAVEIVGREIGRAGLGRLKILLDEDGSSLRDVQHHHTGTTRMHVDPQRGVVDEQCRVHGVSNLFVAGSSVFPTAGDAAPTLTIVALALRLGDHVKRLMGRG